MAVAQPRLELLRLIKGTWSRSITLPAPDKKSPMDYFPRGVPAVQFHNRGPSVTEDIEICKN